MAFAAAASKRAAPLAGLLKRLLLAAPSASASGAPAPVAAAALRPAPACFVTAPARRLFSTGATPFRRGDFGIRDSEEEYSSGDDEEDYSGDDEDYSGDEDVVYGRLRSRRFSSVSMFSSAAGTFGDPISVGGCWVSKEDADAVKLKVAMPGVGKERVKVWADLDGLMIEGEGDKDAEYDDDDDEAPARYRHLVEFPEDAFKMDQIKAEMKDGMLQVSVPKIKLEDRKDVFQVKVE